MFIKDEFLIVFGEDYNRHPHALEHIVNHLIPLNKVLWVETMGLRTPKLTIRDFKRSSQKIKNMLLGVSGKASNSPIPDNLTVISPFIIPFNRIRLIRTFNKLSVSISVKKYIKLNRMSDPIVITSVPNACDYVKEFNEKLSVYFCVDELSLWPGFDYELVKNMEELLLSKVDMVIATADNLAKTKKSGDKITPIITHGVDFSYFNLVKKPIDPASVKICYFGTFDERSDQEIIKYISQNLSEANIYIIGTREVDVPILNEMENIIFIPKVEYNELPDLIKDMDFFILPYKINELTININPLKLKEYLSTGRPVISTPLPEVIKLSEYLYVANNGEEFVNHIRKIIDGLVSHNYEKIITYVKENETWEKKANSFSQLILNKMV